MKIEHPITGEPILQHKVDFRVHEKDDSYTLLEDKGVKTRDWRIIKKLIELIVAPSGSLPGGILAGRDLPPALAAEDTDKTSDRVDFPRYRAKG